MAAPSTSPAFCSARSRLRELPFRSAVDPGTSGVAVKRVLFVVLAVVVLLTGIPLVMGMPPMDCVDCDFGMIVVSGCVVAVLAATAAVALALFAVTLRGRSLVLAGRLDAFPLDRPPRLA